MRRDILVLTVVVAIGVWVRVQPAADAVFGGTRINFLETDAWYHVRLVEHQVRNFPSRVTLDPYAAPGGQYVAIAPLFDTITAALVVAAHGRDADVQEIERVAAVVPPALAGLTLVAAWAAARRLFDRQAGLLAAALLAILPGHFMDRTMLGFVDHHALEALLAVATLAALARAIRRDAPPLLSGTLAGAALGLYLLAWSSGAFLVAILGVWGILAALVVRDPAVRSRTARVLAVASLAALVLVLAVQDPRMHRYGSQIVSLAGLGSLALGLLIASRRARVRLAVAIVLGALASVSAIGLWLAAPDLVRELVVDAGRLRPDPTRMGVLEARPLFLYPGEWNWLQPWAFFRTGFYLGVVALVALAARIWRGRDGGHLLAWIYALVSLLATIGQNRFGYYLVTAFAIVGGWLLAAVLAWSERAARPWAREAALVLVAGGVFAPNLAPSVLLMTRSGTLTAYWEDAMAWLRRETPPPFVQSAGRGDEYYLARYPRDAVPPPDFTIMNWWDQGYWIVQMSRRVPVSNPTQSRAGMAARFYVETDERTAAGLARADRVRFVLADWEMPFRLTADRAVMGRFQSVLDWAGATHARYYEIYYRRAGDAWEPLWVFHAPYYQSMAYRLMALGGEAGTPARSTTVITFADRDDGRGRAFREATDLETFPTYDAALEAAARRANLSQTAIVGLDPWVTAFPVEPLTAFVRRHDVRTFEQKPTESPWVRVFELQESAATPP